MNLQRRPIPDWLRVRSLTTILLHSLLLLVLCMPGIAQGNSATGHPQGQQAQPPVSGQPAYLQPCAAIAALETTTQWDIVAPSLLSAKTAAVLAAAPETGGGFSGFMKDFLTGTASPTAREAKGSAETAVKKNRRYQLVNDPENADLLIYAFMWKKWGEVWSHVTVVKPGSPDPCEPQILFGRELSRYPVEILYMLEDETKKAEAAIPRAAERWPKQMQEANRKLEKGKFSDAAFEARKAVNTAELGFGPTDHKVLDSLKLLTSVYEKAGWLDCCYARTVFKHTVNTFEEALGPEHPDLAPYLETYAKVLRNYGRNQEADALQSRAASIRTQQR